MLVTSKELREITYSIFQKLTYQEYAEILADELVESNVMGHDDHGVQLIPYYVRAARGEQIDIGGQKIPPICPKGIPEINRQGFLVRIDGMMTFGQVVLRKSAEQNGVMYKVHKAREEIPLDLQVVAFPTPGVYRYEIEEEFRKASLIADVIGMIPHGERTFMEGVESVKLAFSLAKENNKMIDGHVDETDDPNSRFTEELVKEAIRNSMGEKVTISHMTASHSYDSWYFDKLMSMMVSSKVNVVSNPIVSMHLQGRYDSYPKRRGVARIRQMMKAGINVALGTDNIADMIYPLGEGNMLRVAQEAFLVDHFVSEEIYSLMNMITWNGAKAMSLNNYGIGEGRKADFVVLNARSVYEAIRSGLPPALVVYGKHYVVNDLKFSIDGNDVTGLVENLTD